MNDMPSYRNNDENHIIAHLVNVFSPLIPHSFTIPFVAFPFFVCSPSLFLLYHTIFHKFIRYSTRFTSIPFYCMNWMWSFCVCVFLPPSPRHLAENMTTFCCPDFVRYVRQHVASEWATSVGSDSFVQRWAKRVPGTVALPVMYHSVQIQ